MRAPTYTPRERLAIAVADRVVVRLFHSAIADWTEAEVLPTQYETLADCVRRVQADLASGLQHDHRLARVCLYVAGDHPDHGRMLASVPRCRVPVEVEHPLADPHYPAPRSTA